jgi:uncharacterized protein (DUF433 family)
LRAWHDDPPAESDRLIEPAMQGRWCKPESLGRAFDGHAVALRDLISGFKACDFPVRAQTADAIGGERHSSGGGASLAIEDAGDDRIRIVSGQASQQVDGVFERGAAWSRDGRSLYVRTIDIRELMPADALGKLIMAEHLVRGGTPVFAGTRVPIKMVLDLIDSGAERQDLIESYPFLTDAHITAARDYREQYPNFRLTSAAPKSPGL